MIGWYASVPSHWHRARVKSVAERVTDGAHISPDTENGLYDFVSTRDVKGGTINFAGSLKTSQETYEYMVQTGCRPRRGDILFSKDGTVGETAIVTEEHDFVVASSLVIITPRLGVMTPSYLAYLLRSRPAQEQAASFMRGAGLPRLSVGNLARLEILMPPVVEQQAIADYLDRETARIDTLIEEQRRLIEMLRERRQGVLSRASDGDCATVSLGLLLEGIKDGTHGSFSRIDSDEGMPLLGARNVMGSRVVLDGAESFISEEDHHSIVANGFPARGDVLLVIVGATIGKTAVYDLDTRHAFQRSVAFLRPTDHFESKFLWYQIQASRFQDELALRAKTSAQPGIYLGDLTAIPVVVPPREKQRQIVAYLDEQTAKIDTLIAESKRFVELSRERRAALITAAVTGQIDVREMV